MLSTATSGAVIHYTYGDTVTENSPVASSPIVLTSTQWIRAAAFESGMQPSPLFEQLYTITAGGSSSGGSGGTVATVTPSLVGGTYSGPISVTLSTATTGAVIHYTYGDTVTENSPVASGPIVLNSTSWIRAAAFKSGMQPSPVIEQLYTIR
jgi:hypothetical protein